jgi:hypothetical protein
MPVIEPIFPDNPIRGMVVVTKPTVIIIIIIIIITITIIWAVMIARK